MKRGDNIPGLRTVGDKVKFTADNGEDLNEEIELTKNLLEYGKKNKMSQQLKIWLLMNFKTFIWIETYFLYLNYE